ncbi:GGDEF domain-containing protein [Roseateles sp.]|uniref:GGDEF domain-containing protein n=1 Tax=Roseateles sp. TaxID=1971397 RepID=UPI0031D26E9A
MSLSTVTATSGDTSATAETARMDRVKPTRHTPALWVPRVDALAEFGLMISRHLTQCRRYGGHLAVLWLEAEPLAREGQSWPPEAQDALMTAVGRRLRSRVRGTDMVLQVGETSFAVMLLDAGSSEAHIVQQRLMQVLNGPYNVEEHTMHVGLNLGSAVFPEGGVRGADLAESARSDLRRRVG